MASYSVSGAGFPTGSGIKTTSGSTADTATISTPLSERWVIEIHCTFATGYVDIRCDGTAAVAGAASTIRVPAGTSVAFPASYLPQGTLSVVGSGGNETYAVNVLPRV